LSKGFYLDGGGGVNFSLMSFLLVSLIARPQLALGS